MNIDAWLHSHFKSGDFALITGTTTGIGHSYAKELAKRKCNLICIANEGQELATQAKDFEREYDIKVISHNVDFRDSHATMAIAKEVASLPIKILINNAGFGLKGRFEANDVQDYVDIISVNATAPVILLRAILPEMQKRAKGLVIHVSSINSLLPIPKNQVYTATKAFCSSYASAVARENKDSGIDFQLVLPGTTRTPFHDRQGAKPQKMTMMPEDVVNLSLQNVSKAICIPNRGDRILAKVVPFLPHNFRMDLASYILSKRLGI